MRQGEKVTERYKRLPEKNMEKWKRLGGGNVGGNISKISMRERQGLYNYMFTRLVLCYVLVSLRNTV